MIQSVSRRAVSIAQTRTPDAELLAAQDGRCRICGKSPKAKALAVDHNHATQKVRALLCFDCNVSIGKFEERIDRLQAAIDYLREHGVT